MRRNARQLRNFPLCARCEANGRIEPAVQVDHVIPLFKGGAEREENLQSLCVPCHVIKTNEDIGARPRIGGDGWPVEIGS
jgi:5-methylcytosine-specific restriction protein A